MPSVVLIKTKTMERNNTVNELIHVDELVNDFEFAERLYTAGLSAEMSNYYCDRNLIWQDMI